MKKLIVSLILITVLFLLSVQAVSAQEIYLLLDPMFIYSTTCGGWSMSWKMPQIDPRTATAFAVIDNVYTIEMDFSYQDLGVAYWHRDYAPGILPNGVHRLTAGGVTDGTSVFPIEDFTVIIFQNCVQNTVFIPEILVVSAPDSRP